MKRRSCLPNDPKIVVCICFGAFWICDKLSVCQNYVAVFRAVVNFCSINRLINFSVFVQPPGTYLDPPFINFKEIEDFMYPSFRFLSFLVLFTPNMHGKIACFCIYFSFMLSDNLFLFFPSLYNHLKPFLKFRLPRLLNFGVYSSTPVY